MQPSRPELELVEHLSRRLLDRRFATSMGSVPVRNYEAAPTLLIVSVGNGGPMAIVKEKGSTTSSNFSSPAR
jgi:hypothetical protein